MDRRERRTTLHTAMLAFLEGAQAKIWTAFPAIVKSFDATKQTCILLPATEVRVLQKDGTYTWVAITQLQDCPVIFPGGGGYTLTFPIQPGDEALVIIASRCIDSWWQQGGTVDNPASQPPEIRMHDLSDGFAIVGPRSQPRKLSGVSTDACQLRSDDGETLVELSPGKIQLIADEVVIHGRNKASFDAGGTGFVYQPAQIDTYTDGVPSNGHVPNPPGPLT